MNRIEKIIIAATLTPMALSISAGTYAQITGLDHEGALLGMLGAMVVGLAYLSVQIGGALCEAVRFWVR